jgi:hypothetical protein
VYKPIKRGSNNEIQYFLKGIVSYDFDGLFMILSYVRHVPLHIFFYNFMLSFVNYIIKDDAV